MKEQNKPETKVAAQNHSGFNLYSMTDTAYEKYLSFIEGANWMKGQLYTAEDCAKMLVALRQRCAEEAKAYIQGLLISDSDSIESDIEENGGYIEVDKQSILSIDLNQFLQK